MKKLYLILMLIGIQSLYAQVPVISLFAPAKGPMGTTVTITGSNFNATAGSNIVYFGTNRANVVAATTTQLTVTAPAASAYQPISVLNTATALTGYSKSPFINTFPSKKSLALTDFDSHFDIGTSVDNKIKFPQTVCFADLDGDSRQDLIIANSGSISTAAPYTFYLSVMLNNFNTGAAFSAASFNHIIDVADSAQTTAPTTSNPGLYSVAAADLNGDGKPDLVVSNNSLNTISVFRNTSTGVGNISFVPVTLNLATAGGAKVVVIGDYDKDGKPDIAVTCSVGNRVCIFPNTTTGGSITFGTRVNLTTDAGSINIAQGDLDGDGKIDLVTANATVGTNNLSLFRNISTPGNINFEAGVQISTALSGVTPPSPYGLAVGDLNGDGKPDIIASTYSNTGTPANNILVYRNVISTAGSFTPGSFSSGTLTHGSNSYGITLADMDGDGMTDIVSANIAGSTAGILRNKTVTGGAISFATSVALPIGANDAQVFICDMDGDGKPDIATANSITTTVSLIRNAPTPFITTSAGATIFSTPATGAATPVVVDAGLVIYSKNNTPLVSDTVAIANNFNTAEDSLAFTAVPASMGNITGTYNKTTGKLILTSLASPIRASIAQWQTALRSIAYTNNNLTPAVLHRTITFTANDGTNVSGPATKGININYRSNVKVDTIVLSAGTLSPVFTSATKTYTATVPNTSATITITPTLDDPMATATVNGNAVPSGAASGPVALTAGSTTPVTLIVTAQDGTTSTYTIAVTRPLSPDATLSALTLSNGTVSPAFNPAVTTYNAWVGSSVTSTILTPTAGNANISGIKVNGTTVSSGSASTALPLIAGNNTLSTVVTAQDGTTKTYTVTVYRAKSPTDNANAELAAIQLNNGALLSPSFNPNVSSYTSAVANDVTSIGITPTTQNSGAVAVVNGPGGCTACGCIPLVVGDNAVTIVVTAADHITTQTYTLIVNRAGSANTDLAYLGVGSYGFAPVMSPAAFSKTTYNYAVTIAGSATNAIINTEAVDSTATVTVNGISVTSSKPWSSVALPTTLTNVTIAVTAPNGDVKNTIVNITKNPLSNDAGLQSLVISAGTLSPAFSSATTSYTASVANAVSSITVTPKTNVGTAKITVNDSTVNSGYPSGSIALNPGSDTIRVKVTAENGALKTYTIIVTRASGMGMLMAANNTITYDVKDYAPVVVNNKSNQTISYNSSNPDVAVIVNGKIHVTGTGATTITALQAANGSNTKAEQRLIVDKASQKIDFAPIGTMARHQVKSVTAKSSTGYPLTFTSSALNVVTISAGADSSWLLKAIGTGTSIITAMQNGTPHYLPAAVTQMVVVNDDDININVALSPNGDGVNDTFVINGIEQSSNKLIVFDRNGSMVFEKVNYGNAGNVFDGHSGITGKLLPKGSYFYVLEYKQNNISNKRQGYIILKY